METLIWCARNTGSCFLFTFLDGCGHRWSKVYSNDYLGNGISGNIDDLLDAVVRGAFIKVAVDYASIFYSVQTAYIIDGHVCVQVVHDININGVYEFTVSIVFYFLPLFDRPEKY